MLTSGSIFHFSARCEEITQWIVARLASLAKGIIRKPVWPDRMIESYLLPRGDSN